MTRNGQHMSVESLDADFYRQSGGIGCFHSWRARRMRLNRSFSRLYFLAQAYRRKRAPPSLGRGRRAIDRQSAFGSSGAGQRFIPVDFCA